MEKVVAPFAHLIDAEQIMEEGDPMKLKNGCRRRVDIPKEIPVVFGGKEFRLTMAIRDLVEERGSREDTIKLIGDEAVKEGGDDTRKETIAGVESHQGKKKEGESKTMEARKEEGGFRGLDGDDAVSSTLPVRRISHLGQTKIILGNGVEEDAILGVRFEQALGVSREKTASRDGAGGSTRMEGTSLELGQAVLIMAKGKKTIASLGEETERFEQSTWVQVRMDGENKKEKKHC